MIFKPYKTHYRTSKISKHIITDGSLTAYGARELRYLPKSSLKKLSRLSPDCYTTANQIFEDFITPTRTFNITYNAEYIYMITWSGQGTSSDDFIIQSPFGSEYLN